MPMALFFMVAIGTGNAVFGNLARGREVVRALSAYFRMGRRLGWKQTPQSQVDQMKWRMPRLLELLKSTFSGKQYQASEWATLKGHLGVHYPAGVEEMGCADGASTSSMEHVHCTITKPLSKATRNVSSKNRERRGLSFWCSLQRLNMIKKLLPSAQLAYEKAKSGGSSTTTEWGVEGDGEQVQRLLRLGVDVDFVLEVGPSHSKLVAG